MCQQVEDLITAPNISALHVARKLLSEQNLSSERLAAAG
jgi:hypothetical protein